MYLRSLPR